jgi:hypothetical protein
MSRLRLWVCACEPLIRLRAGHDDLEIMCLDCMTVFRCVEASPNNKRRPRK